MDLYALEENIIRLSVPDRNENLILMMERSTLFISYLITHHSHQIVIYRVIASRIVDKPTCISNLVITYPLSLSHENGLYCLLLFCSGFKKYMLWSSNPPKTIDEHAGTFPM